MKIRLYECPSLSKTGSLDFIQVVLVPIKMFLYVVIMHVRNKLTHKVLSKSSGIKSSALGEQLAGFFLSQVCGHNKELGIECCFSRLPDCQGTQLK